MNIEQYIKSNKLASSKALKYYLLGKEHELFEVEDNDIRNIFNKKKQIQEGKSFFKRGLYRLNYFLFLLFIILFFVITVENKFIVLFFLLLLSFKPLAHFFALKNKISSYNIDLYRSFYGENILLESDNISEIQEIPEFQEKADKKRSNGLIIVVVIGVLILLSFPFRSIIGEEVIKEDSSDKSSRPEIVKTNLTTDKEKPTKEVVSKSNELTEEELAQLEAESESDMMVYGEELMTSKTEEKKDNSATITGSDIIMRNGHSTKSKIVGSFKQAGEKVVVIGNYTSEEQTVLIKNEVIVSDTEGKNNILPKGKFVKIIAINEESPVEILISFKTKEGESKEGIVSKNDLDYINESWYKVKRG
ncbi:hypothetical protein [Formosa sp. L2A11]|uniref:hypothetical protein n=1 Tax=Formosa sp. L2A11 TaxID=2686363 RepID=UPI00131A96E0|nr:hypothetical protein [Formosa sp. L2A11]